MNEYLVIKTTPMHRTLLGFMEERTTMQVVGATSADDAAQSIDAPVVGTTIRVVKVEDVSFFERTSQIERQDRT